MKKNLLTLALIIVTTASSLFANNAEGVNTKVMSSFKKEFGNVSDVKWDVTKDFTRATFKIQGQVMFAYYAENGSMLALSRNLLSSHLPINLSADLKKTYKSYWISDLFEMASNNETTYYATVENADHTIVLKSVGAGGWDQFKKEKKNIQ